MKLDEIKTIVKDNSNAKKNPKLLSRLMSLPIEQKACLFILLMGVLGTVIGGINTEVAVRGCTLQKQCLVVDTAQKRLDAFEQGAYAGMSAAFFLSLPALLTRFREL
jgi:hypothetical protein